MSTYYWIEGKLLIGKSSPAGPYCWKCGVTADPDGTQFPPPVKTQIFGLWLKKCPVCGERFTRKALRFKWVIASYYTQIMELAEGPDEDVLISDDDSVHYTAREFVAKALNDVPLTYHFQHYANFS